MTLWYILGLSFILTHELDAMTAKEWLIFPGLSRLEDATGQALFVVLHVPLFFVLLWGSQRPYESTWFAGFDTFLILHVFAHLLLHRHPKNGFRRPLSWILILGAGLSGALDLLTRSLI